MNIINQGQCWPCLSPQSLCVVLSIGGLEILCHQPVPDGPALNLAVLRTHCHRPHVQVPPLQPPSSTATFVIPLPPYLFLSGYIVLSIYLFFFRLKKLISRAGICFFLSEFFFFYFCCVFLFDLILISLHFFFSFCACVCTCCSFHLYFSTSAGSCIVL